MKNIEFKVENIMKIEKLVYKIYLYLSKITNCLLF